MVSSLFVIVLILSLNNALDCSQFGNYSSCVSTHCAWRQFECKCASPVNLDILFTISTSSYIGTSNFNNVLKPWLTAITATGINIGVSHVGWNIFGASSTLTDIQSTSYNQMATHIQNIQYDSGVADLATALMTTQSAFMNTAANRQKINIIIMGSNPYKEGTTTSEVCGHAAKLKQLGIKSIFIGIGRHWKQSRIDCLVQDLSTDIIRIESWNEKALNDSLPLLYDILCATNLDIKITEIKPVRSQQTNANDARFIEFFNSGRDIQSMDTLSFDGLITGSMSNVTIYQGQYAVLYNVDDGNILCSTCNNSAIYIQCGSANSYNCQWDTTGMTLTDFNIAIMDGSGTSTSNNIYDSVSYDDYMPNIKHGYSYALEYVGYNNAYGANYIRSCDIYATPGTHNRACTPTELQCQYDTDCSLGGDRYCDVAQGRICVCSDIGYYYKQNSCYRIPTPSNCIAYQVKNGSQKYTQFEWDAAHMDSNHIYYGNTYYKDGFNTNQMVTVVDVSRIRNEDDLYVDVTDIAGYVFTRMMIDNQTEYNSGKWLTNCSVITQSPTSTPTQSPSPAPSIAPTQSPTAAPTWQIPKVYLSGEFCSSDRCNCASQDFECCLDIYSNSSAIDNYNYNCTQQQLNYIVGDEGNNIFQSITIHPETFPYPTVIQWTLRFNGTVGYVNANAINNNNNHTSIQNNINPLAISIYPMNGTSIINGSSSVNIKLFLNRSHIICPNNATYCTPQLIGSNAVFIFEIVQCSTMNMENRWDECDVIYPYDVAMYIQRSDIVSGDGGIGQEEKIATWVWFVLGAAAVFLLLLSWLLYRYWWKGKKQDTDYKLLKDDVEIQKVQNDEDFETNLINNKDVEFNPLATGMPGVDKTHDPLTVEVEKREIRQQSEMIQQDAVKQVFKEDMGQVQGKLSQHYQ